MLVSTKTPSLMQRLATQRACPQRQGSIQQRQGAPASSCKMGILSNQFPDFVGKQRTDTAATACSDCSCLFQQRRLDRNGNVLFGRQGKHPPGLHAKYVNSLASSMPASHTTLQIGRRQS